MKNNIIVVGGGPAGMMAAIRARQLGIETVLFEKNTSLGKKMLLSGKGRCNLTNLNSLEDFLANFSQNANFLRDAFKTFFNTDLIHFFEAKSLKLKIERQNRVFPSTDNAQDVVNVLKKYLSENKVKIIYSSSVCDIGVADSEIRGLKLNNGRYITATKIILASGGASYPQTGSTGDGFKMVERLGHRVISLRPGLVPLETKEAWVKDLQGLNLKNIRLKIDYGKKKEESAIGEMLFTHFGISGPLILNLSGKLVDLIDKFRKPLVVAIDLKPGLTEEQLLARLRKDLEVKGKKIFKNTLEDLLPKRLIPVFIRLLKINPYKKASQINLQERKKILDFLKNFPLTIKGARPLKEAMITRGGISVKEINPKTMESLLIHGLYFCGEIIDVDGLTGGYNLQAAFSTGYLAGESAAKAIHAQDNTGF